MKKIFMIALASLALAACSGGNNSEANRDESENYTEEVTPQDNSREGMDTVSTDMQADTVKSGGTTGSTSGSGVDGSDMNGTDDGGTETAPARP